MNYKYIFNPSNLLIPLLASLPLPFAFINIAFGLFIFAIILNYKQLHVKFSYTLLIPVIYYLLCVASLSWTIEAKETGKYLSKGLFFIALPILFSFLPKIKIEKRQVIFNNYSYLMAIATIFYLLRALYRFIKTGESHYFFYHDLVTLDVNAIYISLFISFAFINLFIKKNKQWYDFLAVFLLFAFLILLSSKNVIVITLLGIIISFFYNKSILKKKNILLILGVLVILMIPLGSKIKERFDLEIQNTTENVKLENGIINVSIENAWEQDSFGPQYYFNGTAFRLYQIRLFKEFLNEDHIFWTGYGASASQDKIIEKQKINKLVEYYGTLNFHNQYIQSFAELGIIGVILLCLMVVFNWIKAIKNRDFVFLFFTILTTSIMFTESLFHRQRGIVFFILLYCIFHSTLNKKNTL
ncbi:O-antigen ligase family protein [Empedobacter falsenii]|uniref:Lipid A core - O-antigen ligase and related enzymes n=1 Tax=Empedobacter falsenii TaxID=343874 RepID=A0A376FYU0_9FLAO|nr:MULTISPECIES: O-antigen ligase family protein [Empedobacter]MDM1043205.1 O-antigen ligase family protein [Empedobacter brevis]MDM1137131.1 O-antigen ligase family protein [Empedobacter sp. R750]STD53535.1 Lipid A core - O-antigen ligase and related enzymes [Empedobacter falsenii]